MNEPFYRLTDTNTSTNTNYPYFPFGRPEHDTTETEIGFEVSDCAFSLLVDP